MSKPTIALVTAEAARDLDEDLPPLESALRNAGADVVIAEWDRPHDWSRFDIALLRSTWDYPQRLAEFFDWAAQVSTQTKLLNPLSVVKWSSDKHYMRDLAHANVPTVLTKFIEPGESAPWRIAELLGEPDVNEFVVKPAIGAGSRDAQRFGPEEKDDAAEHAQRMLSEKRSVLLQPYLSRVDELWRDGADLLRGPVQSRDPQGTAAEEEGRPDAGVVRERDDHGASAGCGGVASGSESDPGDAVRDAAVRAGGFDQG